MIRSKGIPILSCLLLFVGIGGLAGGQQPPASDTPAYHKPADVVAQLKDWAAKYPVLARLESIGKSAGGRELFVLRIAGPGSAAEKRPAVLVSANLEGSHIIGTEAALRLAEKLLTADPKDAKLSALLAARTFYIAPLLNPDGTDATFGALRTGRFGNARPVDEDADGVVDEDGFEDLDKDGAITQMRVKDPEGRFIPDPKEPRLMRLADANKGEKGIYKLYSEGIDNDGDGEYNEDPAGGVEINRNFPHDFEYFIKAAGLYPVSENETIALLKFLDDHPQIALVLNFSTENTILNQRQTGQAKPGSDKVKLPKELAGYIGLEADQDYTLKEIAAAATSAGLGGGVEITEEMVAGFLGQGAAVEIDKTDQPLFEAVQKDYKDALKAAKLEDLEKHAKGVGKGSFAAYVYYQYGAPVFSTDLWQVPESKKEEPADKITADKLKEMTKDQFLALGEEKIGAFLKDAGAPPNFGVKQVMEMVKTDKVTPAQMAEMMAQMPKKPGAEGEDHPDAYKLKWAETALAGKGFTNWAPYKHPLLGDVEIGGFCPHFGINPPVSEMNATIKAHVDFYLKLAGDLPVLEVSEVKAESLGGETYKLSAFVSNTGRFPTATAQGRRAGTAWPVRVSLGLDKAETLFSGRPVEEISVLNGGETKKLEWTIRAKKGSKVGIKAWAPKLGAVEKTVVLD